MNNQKGITLVALIITIIVMLILVAVTISIAVSGGLFDTAKDARDKTIKEMTKEAITLAKAEVVTDFYASDTKINDEDFGTKVQGYLDSSVYTVSSTASSTAGHVTVTITEVATGLVRANEDVNLGSILATS